MIKSTFGQERTAMLEKRLRLLRPLMPLEETKEIPMLKSYSQERTKLLMKSSGDSLVESQMLLTQQLMIALNK